MNAPHRHLGKLMWHWVTLGVSVPALYFIVSFPLWILGGFWGTPTGSAVAFFDRSLGYAMHLYALPSAPLSLFASEFWVGLTKQTNSEQGVGGQPATRGIPAGSTCPTTYQWSSVPISGSIHDARPTASSTD